MRVLTAWTAVVATAGATGFAVHAAQADGDQDTAVPQATTTTTPDSSEDFGSSEIPSPPEAPSASSETPDATSGGS